MMENYLTTKQAAEILGITQVAVRKAIVRGRLQAWKPDPGVKLWLIAPEAVEAYRRDFLGRRGRRSPSNEF